MLLQILELACNQALEHDPVAREKLATLEGKTVVLEVKNLNQKVVILPQPFGIELATYQNQSASVTLAATPNAMLKIAYNGMNNAELEVGELEINGDPVVAQRFAALVSSLNVDWEGLLADHVGELPASMITRGITAAREVAKESQELVKQNISRTLVDDLKIVAAGADVESFLEGVDELRAAVDRLEARLERIINA